MDGEKQYCLVIYGDGSKDLAKMESGVGYYYAGNGNWKEANYIEKYFLDASYDAKDLTEEEAEEYMEKIDEEI